MNKQIAVSSHHTQIETIFKEHLGGCATYTVPCGNLFFESLDGEVEVCVFRNGRISLCGLGEYKRVFNSVNEFLDFIIRSKYNGVL